MLLVLSLLGVVGFHLWSDGRNAASTRQLRLAGATAEQIQQQIRWLCAPLNLTALALLVALVFSFPKKA
jgi:hypothetical protein